MSRLEFARRISGRITFRRWLNRNFRHHSQESTDDDTHRSEGSTWKEHDLFENVYLSPASYLRCDLIVRPERLRHIYLWFLIWCIFFPPHSSDYAARLLHFTKQLNASNVLHSAQIKASSKGVDAQVCNFCRGCFGKKKSYRSQPADPEKPLVLKAVRIKRCETRRCSDPVPPVLGAGP